jgi:PAS domain S-box-containing protein
VSDEFRHNATCSHMPSRDKLRQEMESFDGGRATPNAQLRAEERFQRALAIDTVGVLFFTLDGRLTDANAAFERMSGYTREELRAMVHWKELTAPEFLAVTARAAQELAERGETAPFEKQMVRKDGSRWWGLFAPKRIDDGGHDAECVEFIIDITDRKDAEERLQAAGEALQELEERQRMALNAAELGTWKHDLASGLVELDARARAHYGVDAQVVAIEEILARIHADDAPSLQRAIADALDPNIKRPVAAEYRVIQPNGAVRWLSVNGLVHFADVDGTERATLAIGTTRDVTEQKRVEQTLREADRRKDEFLAILAHELRNPLAPIRTAVGILRSQNVPDRVLMRSRDVIERQVAHMARLIDDLLDVSRLSQGKLSLQRARVLVDEVLDSAIETAKPLIHERGHKLTVNRASGAITLHADVARLSQVFANLLNNAAKYTPPGGSITVDVVEDARHVNVRVSDTGEGIAADHLEKVFDLFAQGAGASTHGAGGLGIGLALARRLVELHGGSVTAWSPGVGRGATFTVRLPTVDTSLNATIVAESTEAAVTNLDRRVLVVDDNTDAADTTAMLLQASGCDVRTAYGGEQALRLVPEFDPDVVLLDLGMPGLDGIETCRQIRMLASGGSMLIVAVTGWGQEEDRRRTQLAGFDAHLVKPVDPHSLLRLIENSHRRAG